MLKLILFCGHLFQFKALELICTAEQNLTESRPEAEVPNHCADFWKITDDWEQNEKMKQNFAKVNIYFESLNFETIEQSEDYPVRDEIMEKQSRG